MVLVIEFQPPLCALAHYRYIHLLTQSADWRQLFTCVPLDQSFSTSSTIWGWIILLYIVSYVVSLTSVYSMPVTPTQPQLWKWRMSCHCHMSPGRQNSPLLRTTVLVLKWKTSWRPSLFAPLLQCLRAKDLSTVLGSCVAGLWDQWILWETDSYRPFGVFLRLPLSAPTWVPRATLQAALCLENFSLPGRGTTQMPEVEVRYGRKGGRGDGCSTQRTVIGEGRELPSLELSERLQFILFCL